MSKTLRLDDIWKVEDWDNNTVHILGKNVQVRLKRLYPDYDNADIHGYDLYDIVENFGFVSTCEDAELPFTPMEEFDNYMVQLYDWADANDLWVQTVV